MKNKTVLQELITDLKESSEIGNNQFIIKTIDLIIRELEYKLEKEKNQIIEAFDSGKYSYTLGNEKNYEGGEEYYQEIYGETN